MAAAGCGTIGLVSLQVTTDANEICALLEPLVEADPVRHTVLGTILTILQAGEGEGWCAAWDGGLAVRSSRVTPVALTAGWTDIDLLVDELATLPSFVGITGPVDVVDTVTVPLARRIGASAHRIATRLFRLDELTRPDVAGTSRVARAADRPLLLDWYTAFGLEAVGFIAGTDQAVDHALAWGRVWLWLDEAGEPVSLAARRAPNAGSARVGPVYTPPARRKHGYGCAVTAAATADILADGAIPVLFTDLANPVSNAIYQRLGYYAVGDYAHVNFR